MPIELYGGVHFDPPLTRHAPPGLRLLVWIVSPSRRISRQPRGRALGLRLRLGARYRALSKPRLQPRMPFPSSMGSRGRSDYTAPPPPPAHSATLCRASQQALRLRRLNSAAGTKAGN